MMRIFARAEAENERMRRLGTELMAAGFTKCEVVVWGYKKGFVGSQMSAAVGIPQDELPRACPYP
jgi:hypothetical protein